MADNDTVKNADNQTITAATDELSDGSKSPKVTLLSGAAGSPTPISPSTSGLQETANTLLTTIKDDIVLLKGYTDGLEAKIDAVTSAVTAATLSTFTNVDSEYEPVAASQTAQVLGPTGATGDYISHVLVVPASLSPGNVLLLDNATSITIFAGGTNSVLSLIPFAIPLAMKSVSGAWKITTGANVSVIGVGTFT